MVKYMEKTKIMFDSNAFDRMNNDILRIKNSVHICDYYVTSVQVRELCEINDSKKEKRTSNIMNLCEIRAKLVCTPFTFDYIDFGHLNFEGSQIYPKLLKQNKSNVKDALIGATAAEEGCILVTEDVELRNKMLNANQKVLSYDEFIEKYIEEQG